MKSYVRDHIFWIVVFCLCLLHVDFCAWGKIYPMLFGWIPYHLYYDGVLTIIGALTLVESIYATNMTAFYMIGIPGMAYHKGIESTVSLHSERQSQ
ncbi:MAG: hypothetical protein NTX75_00595 [Proteobacteria bacterium]|nr:hypothetical protein [Pseudomonadota bacterium]